MERTKVFDKAKNQEASFVSSLFEVLECVINPINVRDTPFKRNFMNDPSVALSFNLLFEIHKAASNFYFAIVNVKNDADIAKAYSNFAPSLQLFAQYTAENSKFLNSVERNRKSIVQCMAREVDFIPVFIEPLNHYLKYRMFFQEFVRHTDPGAAELPALQSALENIVHQTEYVDVKLQEEKESLMLLHLQNQFSGNAVIFTPSRKLLREGDVERIRVKKSGELESKAYYAHLFNDCVVFSTKRLTGGFRLHAMYDFKSNEISSYDKLTGVTFGFTIASKDDPEKGEDYRMLSEEVFNDWMAIINAQIDLLKTHRIAKRSSAMNKASKMAAIAGVSKEQLAPRCARIYQFLIEEKEFVDIVNAMNSCMIQPLMTAAKGAVLSAALPSTDENADGFSRYDNNEANFEKSAASATKFQTQQVTDALKEPDVVIFLRAAEGMARAVREFVKTVEQQCAAANWNDSLVIGPAFNSVAALALYNQFKSYSSGQQAMLRVLRTPPFAPFYIDVENYLSGFPGTLQEKIELPRKCINVYLSFIQDLFNLTPENHVDHIAVKSSLQAVSSIEKEIVELIRMKKNFEKLLEIQNSLSLFSTDPFVQKIATMERTFLLEGDLKKVCRKKNKPFRFWLFNDFVVYGASMGSDNYSFNRSLELSKCSIAANANEKNAIEIYGSEKSFVVIAPTEEKFNLWLETLSSACAKARSAAGVTTIEAAPLWKPDSESNNCPLCNKAFTFWNRKHHCRKCGGLMCSDHLKNQEILPHIHKTQKQKVCDDCVAGKNTKVVPPVLPQTSSAPASAPVPAPVSMRTPPPAPKPVASTTTTTTLKPFFDSIPADDDGVKPSPVASVPAPSPVPAQTAKPLRRESTMRVPPPMPSTPAPAAAPAIPSFPPSDEPTTPPPQIPAKEEKEQTPQSTEGATHARPLRTVGKVSSRYQPNSAPSESTAPPSKPVGFPRRGSVIARIAEAKSKFAAAAPPSAVSPAESTGPKSSDAGTPITTTESIDSSDVHAVSDEVSPQSPIPPAVPVVVPTNAVEDTPAPVNPVPTPVIVEPPKRASVHAPPPPPPRNSVHEPVPPPRPASVAVPSIPVVAPSPATPPPPPIPQMQRMSIVSPPPAPPAPAVHSVAPAVPVPAAAAEDVSADDPLKKYKKMKEMLPEGAVRQKMTADGFNQSDIDKFLAGESISAPQAAPPTVSLAQVTLKTAVNSPSPAPTGPPKLSLLDEIQKGQKLKSVQAEDPRVKAPEPQNAGGILGMLAMEMSKRRFNMNVSDDDDDSDSSGFSDSDSD